MSDSTEKISRQPVSLMESLVLSDRFSDFFHAFHQDNQTAYVTLGVPFENIDPLAVLELNGDSDGTRFYWERPEYEMALAAGNKAAVLRNSGSGRFRNISRQSDSLLQSVRYFSEINHSMAGAHLAGGFSFFDQSMSGSWSSLGNASFFLPEWLLVRDGQFSMINITRPWNKKDSLEEIQNWFLDWINQFVSRLSNNIERSRILRYSVTPGGDIMPVESEAERIRWIHNVTKARQHISEGHYRKIVIARDLKLRTKNKVSSTKLVHFLRKEYPSCYTFMYQLNGDATFLGSTPEKLLSLHSQYIKTEALAGSIPRGNTATQDAILEKKLQESSKNREEHAYVLDAIKDKLSMLSDSLEYAPEPVIKKYANVQHLCTPVAASLRNNMNPVDIMEQLHPTPAVGGYPELDAMQKIQELEQIERGWYAGPVGWFNSNRRAEFSVAIRSGLIRRNHVQFFSGCGIVEDSNPEAEWEETRIKFIPMQKALEYALE